MTKKFESQPMWLTVARPGYQGKKKDEQTSRWNADYGEGEWRIAWELQNGVICNYDQIFYNFYVAGYVQHFLENLDEASQLTANYSYTYDKDVVPRSEAFDPHALYDKPGRPNQFHNVALNIALEYYLGLPFKGQLPLQVREGKPGSDPSTWPQGWRWSPGRISAVRQDLIPHHDTTGWWQKGSIEDLYQTAKVFQVKYRL